MNLASMKKHVLLAAVAIALPGAALAQNDVTDQADQVAETARELEQEANALGTAVTEDAQLADDSLDGDLNDRDGDEGKWGLLGLLGLAGLLGLRRRDDRDDHIRTNTTRDTTRDTTVGPDTNRRM